MATRRNALKEFIYQDEGETKREISVVEIPIEQFISWKDQPRKYFPKEHIASLARSIQERGLDYPLTVRPSKEFTGKYEVIKGECRFQGGILAGKTTLSARIKELNDEEALDEALDENLNRKDLNPLEELDGLLRRLAFRLDTEIDEVPSLLYEMKNQWEKMDEDVRENVFPEHELHKVIVSVFESHGRNWYSFTCSRLKLKDLPCDLYQAIASGKIEYSKGLKLKVVTEQQERKKLLDEAIAQDWSHREITEKVKEWQATKVKSPKKNLTPTQRVKQLSDRIKNQNWRDRPELLSQLEKKLATLEKWLDEKLDVIDET